MRYWLHAWDASPASWTNVFSETLTRVFTLFACDRENHAQLTQQIEALVQEGFIYARPMAETLFMTGQRHPLSNEWLDQCLRSCAETTKRR